MKNKLTLLLAGLFVAASLFSQTTTATAAADSVARVALEKQKDSLLKHNASLTASLSAAQDSLSKVSVDGNIYDQSAIDLFNKQKDSIYQNSSYGALKCRNCEPPPSKNKHKIIRYNRSVYSILTFWLSVLLFILIWYWGIMLFNKSALCKDPGSLPVEQRSYSYARVQLFWWTMIIISLYLYFFAFTGYLLPFNKTAFILLGSGVIVYSGGKIIDRRQAASLGGSKPEHATEGLFTDLLSDENGVTIHRFQSLLFNVIFGVGFIITFLKNVSFCVYPFPDFGDWQFALLGLSSATYLGLKTTEYAPDSSNKGTAATTTTTSTEEPTVRDIQNH